MNIIKSPPHMGNITPSELKDKSRILAGTNAANKKKETIVAHDNFTLLSQDIDDTQLSIRDIENLLALLGITSFAIHTTASHQYDENGNRYRVFIQLTAGIPFSLWSPIQTYLSYIFGADDCSSRPQQVMYLPARYDNDYYEFKISEGDPLIVEGSLLLNKALKFEQEQKTKELTLSIDKPIKPTYQPQLVGNQVSIISAVNGSYGWEYLLNSYGYKQQGVAFLPPESSSGKAGAYIIKSNTDGRLRYYSHHSSDPCAIGQCLDQFDFITIREFGGDAVAAMRNLAKLFPALNKHNKKEWAIHQHNKRIKSLTIQDNKHEYTSTQ